MNFLGSLLNTPISSISIDNPSAQKEYLLSQLPGLRPSPTHIELFRITNQENSIVEIAIESASCSCLSFEHDGVAIPRKQWWILEANTSCEVAMKAKLPSAFRSTSNSCLLAVRSPTNQFELDHKLLSSKVTVFRDIEAHPSALQISVGTPVSFWKKQIKVTLVWQMGEVDITPVVKLPPPLSNLVNISIKPEGLVRELASSLVTQDYLICLESSKLLRRVKDDMERFQDMSLLISIHSKLLPLDSNHTSPPSILIPITCEVFQPL